MSTGMVGFKERWIPYEMKSTFLKVIDYKGKNLRGILQNPFFEKPMYFDNLSQCLFMMEQIMDALDFPQRGTESRIFYQHEEQTERWQRAASLEEERMPALAMFQIKVFFRQNSSWQGNLIWQEKECEACFRSVLELIGLMDNALSVWE